MAETTPSFLSVPREHLPCSKHSQNRLKAVALPHEKHNPTYLQRCLLEIGHNRHQAWHHIRTVSGRAVSATSIWQALAGARWKWADGRQDRQLVGEERGHLSTLGQMEVDRQNQLYLRMIQNKVEDYSRSSSPAASCPGGECVPGAGAMTPDTTSIEAHEPSPHWLMAFFMSTWRLQSVKYLHLITVPRGRPDRGNGSHFSEE